MSKPCKPESVEGMLKQLTKIKKNYPNGHVPYDDCIIPTHEFFLDFCERLIALEKKVNNGIEGDVSA